MKAIVYEQYGPPDVLEMREVETPVPGDRDLLIKVEAASVNRSDWEGLIGKPLYARMRGLRRPHRTILGSDVAGRVEAVGSAVESFRPGDEVFGASAGSYAQYAAAPEDALAPKPANLTFAQAATVPMAGLVALQAIRDQGNVQPGQTVLVNGASGGIGTFAVQIAKAFGAEVTAVVSTRNV